MKFYLRLALRNLLRHRRRNITTALTVAAGLSGLLLLWSYICRTDHYLVVATAFVNRNGHLTVTAPEGLEKALRDPAKYVLALETQKKIESVLSADPAVEYAAPAILGVGLIGNGCKSFPTFIRATTPETERFINTHPEVTGWTPELAGVRKGRGFYEDAGTANDNVNLSLGLGSLLKKEKVFEPGPTTLPNCADPKTIEADNNVQVSSLTYTKDFAAVDANVAGLFTTGFHLLESSFTEMSLKKAQELFATEGVGRYIVFLKDPSRLSKTKSGLEDKFRDAGLSLEVSSFDHPEIGLFYSGTMQFLYTMAGFFLVLIMFVITFAIGNQLTLSIVERSREIGTLRAIGYKQKLVNRLLVIETMIITLLGGLVGIAFSYAVIWVVNHMGLQFHPPGIAGKMSFKLYAPLSHAFILYLTVSFLCYLGTLVVVKNKTRESVVKLLTATVT